MNKRIQQLLSALSSRRAVITELLVRVSEKDLRAKESVETWSLFEVLHHLTLVEKNTFRTIAKHVEQAANMPKVTLVQHCKNAALRFVLKMPIKFKVPVARLEPSHDESTAVLAEALSEVEQGWAPLLDSLEGSSLDNGLVAHPIAGWMTAEQALCLLCEHYDHHVSQIKKGLKGAGRSDLLALLDS